MGNTRVCSQVARISGFLGVELTELAASLSELGSMESEDGFSN